MLRTILRRRMQVVPALAMMALAAMTLAPSASAKKETPPASGLIAVSGGESVFMVEPATGETRAISTGPVAWLFPAPGGTLFAPDLVNGRTTVVDLVSQTARDTLDGVTMPRFGDRSDRYVVVSKQILVVSYPERALISRMDIPIHHPWQVAVLVGNTVLIVLERDQQEQSEASLVAVNLSDGRLVYRRPLGGDIRHFGISPQLGVIALANAATNGVVLADPATLSPQATFATHGPPVDLVFVEGGTTLAVATETADGRGEVAMWRIKATKKQGLVRKKEWYVALAQNPIRLAASPDERHLVVAFPSGQLQIIDVDSKTVVRNAEVPAAPRDVVWCDPLAPGPMLPDWSDDDPPSLNLGG